MYSVIRMYTGTPALADELKKRIKDIENLITTVPGFINYYLIKTGDGATTITVCQDRTGCDESTQRAANFIKQNLSNLKVNPPQIVAGDIGITFGKATAKV